MAHKRQVSYLFLLSLSFLFAPQIANATIQYTISLAHAEQHCFHVTMVVPNVGRRLDVAIPAWNATYDIRDFAFRVTEVRAELTATNVNSPLRVVRLDKQTWRISAPNGNSQAHLGSVTIQYDDYWNEPGPFSSQLDTQHAFLNLAEVLFYIPARRAEESEVAYTDLSANWRAAEELPAGQWPASFVAANYDALVDAPAEIGTLHEFQLDAGNAHLRVVVDGKDWNQEKLSGDLRKIVSYETGMMRDVPFREYMFIFHFGPYAEMGGGMEHANCTAIAVPSGDIVANVAAHEFFHLWNVKRIRPQTLQPVDFTKEMWTRALWFAEGVTSTYASYTMVRTGLWSHEQFYNDLAQQFTTLDARPAHRWQSAEGSSLDTWLDKYDYYDRPEVSISYYNKGQILGVMLDLAIRNATDNHKSLDDVMRGMDDDYAHRGRFYDDSAGVEQEAEKVAGRSFKYFFQKYVSGTDDIPYGDFLRFAGLDVKVQQRAIPDFGFEVSRGRNGPIQIGAVAAGSSAAQAGLQSGDVLLQLDGQPFPRFAQRWLLHHSPGDKVELRIGRGVSERAVSLTLSKEMVRAHSISEIASASAKQRRIRGGILTGATN